MSKKSDLFEHFVANKLKEILGNSNSERPKTDTHHSDIKFRINENMPWYWLEVKMNTTDNLANYRFFYENNSWKSSNLGKVASFIHGELNTNDKSLQFVNNIKEISKNENPLIKGISGKSTPINHISHSIIKNYFKTDTYKNYYNIENNYILNVPNVNIGELVTNHYLNEKAFPVYYLQAGNNLYMFGNTNPLGINVPQFSGYGDLKVRVSVRSRFYEIQSEIKINNVEESPCSILEQKSKKNPISDLIERY